MKSGIYPRVHDIAGTIGVYNSLVLGGNIGIAMPPNTVENDIMVLFIVHKAAGWASPPIGWTLVGREVSGVVRGEIYWKRAGSSEIGPYEIDGIWGVYAKAYLISYANCITTGSPIDTSTYRANASGVNGTAGITTTTSQALIICAGMKAYSGNLSNFTAVNLPSTLYTVYSAGNTGQDAYGISHMIQQAYGDTGATSWSATAADNVGFCLALLPDPSDPDLTADVTLTGTPTNVDSTSAYDLGTLPKTIIQDLSNTTTSQEVWFKYTPPASVKVFGVYTWYNQAVVVDNFATYFYKHDLSAAKPVGGYMFEHTTRRWTVSVEAGETYYIKIVSNQTSDIGVIFRLQVYAGTANGIEPGDILINDDTPGYPLVVLDPLTGIVQQHYSPFPGGETGAILDNGITLWADRFIDLTHLYLYDTDMELITLVSGVVNVNTYFGHQIIPQIRGEHASKFYVGTCDYDSEEGTTGPYVVYTVTDAGVVGGTTWTLAASNKVYFIGINTEETILYYAEDYGATDLHRWDLVNDVALTDLTLSLPSGYTIALPNDILVLLDGSIIFIARKYSSQDLVLRYAADGTLLRTYTFGTDRVNRLALIGTDDSFWVWGYVNGEASSHYGTFYNVHTSDGTIISQFTRMDGGHGTGYPITTDSNAPEPGFSYSSSCPFMIARVAAGPPQEEAPEPTIVGCKFSFPSPV